MSSLNHVTIVGRLGKDPEIRYMPDGTATANISVATSESWKDKNSGERVEATEWHRLSLFGRIAEIAGEYLHKGDLALFQGKLKTRKYTDKDGIERYTTEIHAREMKMLQTKRDGEGGDSAPRGEGRGERTPPTSTRMQQAQQQGRTDYLNASGRGSTAAPRPAPAPASRVPFDDMADDDIPF